MLRVLQGQPVGGAWTSRLYADGITLAINGQRPSDVRKLPNPDGSAIGGSIETWLPIVDWSDDEVFDFLKARGIARIRYFDHKPRGPECATCPAGWGEGGGVSSTSARRRRRRSHAKRRRRSVAVMLHLGGPRCARS